MAYLIEYDGKKPQIGKDVFLAPTAVLIGDVRVGDNSSIWFGTVLRGDFGPITVGTCCSIQDNAVIHSMGERPTEIGNTVTIGHNATVEGCKIGDNSLFAQFRWVKPLMPRRDRIIVGKQPRFGIFRFIMYKAS